MFLSALFRFQCNSVVRTCSVRVMTDPVKLFPSPGFQDLSPTCATGNSDERLLGHLGWSGHHHHCTVQFCYDLGSHSLGWHWRFAGAQNAAHDTGSQHRHDLHQHVCGLGGDEVWQSLSIKNPSKSLDFVILIYGIRWD